MLATYALVLVYGDRDARVFVHVMLASALLTLVATFTLDRPAFAVCGLLIDACVLGTALWIVARSNSYWPIWYAGFVTIAVCTMAAQQIFPHYIPSIYGLVAGFWVLPAQLVMVIAILRDHRAGLNSGSVSYT